MKSAIALCVTLFAATPLLAQPADIGSSRVVQAEESSAIGALDSSWLLRRHVGEEWALVGGNVVDVQTGEIRENVTILIQGDLIRSITTGPPPKDVRVVEIKDLYVAPGLFDLHAHIQPLQPGMDLRPKPRARPDEAEAQAVLTTLLDHGVTVVRALPLFTEFALVASAHVNDGSFVGPTVIPASAVFEQKAQRTTVPFGDPATARHWVQKEALLGTRWIKIYNAMDVPSLEGIISTARQYGMKVCGHSKGVAPREASQLGIATIEHIIDIPLSCLKEGEKVPQGLGQGLGLPEYTWRLWRAVDERKGRELLQLFKTNGTGWVPTLVVIEQMIKQGRRLRGPVLTDLDKEELQIALVQAAKMVVEFHRLGGLVGIGTDFPVDGVAPGSSVQRELELLVQYGKANPKEALQMATLGSARILGFDELLGSVQSGKLAHLVILKANPLDSISHLRQVEAVVHDGRLRWVQQRNPKPEKK